MAFETAVNGVVHGFSRALLPMGSQFELLINDSLALVVVK